MGTVDERPAICLSPPLSMITTNELLFYSRLGESECASSTVLPARLTLTFRSVCVAAGRKKHSTSVPTAASTFRVRGDALKAKKKRSAIKGSAY